MIDDQPSHQPRKQVHGTRIFLASQWLLRSPRYHHGSSPQVGASTVSMLAEHVRLSASDRSWQ
jgi:hypothetical protein